MSAHHEFWCRVGDFLDAAKQNAVVAVAALLVITVVVVVLSEVLGVW
jgi:hypothetical protein